MNKVFISSTYLENKEIRDKLGLNLSKAGYTVRIAENTRSVPGFVPNDLIKNGDNVEVSDLCLSELANSDIVIGILSGGLGSEIQYNNNKLRAKHFEMEIFSAILQNKPIALYILPTFVPDQETLTFINCLTGKELLYNVTHPGELYDQVVKYCDRKIQTKKTPEATSIIKLLSIIRASFNTVRSHKLFLPFLGKYSLNYVTPNLDLAKWALLDASKQDDLHIRLGRLWVAIKELMPSNPTSTNDSEVRLLWRDLLKTWISCSSWYGLHSHIYLGTVASTTALWNFQERERIATSLKTEMPVGAVASANYSLIQRIPSAFIRHFAYRSLLRFLDKNIPVSSSAVGNLLIRGSINLRLGNPWGGITDFKKALHIVESSNSTPASAGNAKVHLALGLAMALRRREARALMDEGLGEIRGNVGPGELMRALRKAMEIETKIPFGDRERAAKFKREADAIAANSNSYLDQVRHFPNIKHDGE
jgi:hypothetical protein